jgi:hypothetical protein
MDLSGSDEKTNMSDETLPLRERAEETLPVREQKILKKALSFRLGVKAQAKKLRKEWENRNLIKDGTMYSDISQNHQLMKMTRYAIAMCLPTDVNVEDQGIGLISQFDLFFNCSKDSDLNAFIEMYENRTSVKVSESQRVKLRKGKNNYKYKVFYD